TQAEIEWAFCWSPLIPQSLPAPTLLSICIMCSDLIGKWSIIRCYVNRTVKARSQRLPPGARIRGDRLLTTRNCYTKQKHQGQISRHRSYPFPSGVPLFSGLL